MILITGGAGYIGSHCGIELIRAGYDVLVGDNLSEGHKEAILSEHFHYVDLANISEIKEVFKKYKIEAVIHFAASCYVGESATNPQKYYYNNVVSTLNLLNAMLEADVKKIVFSSTCATYGNPQYVPIDEKHPQSPINVYGKTKLMIEQILKDYDEAYGLKYMALRYFNASGADKDGQIGESHSPETHLIPLVLQVAAGQRESIKIFGDDYETPDGTCIRDYIHVSDLAEAHKLALEKLMAGSDSDYFNLGTGNGYSVKEIINATEKITQKTIKTEIEQRRIGDPPKLVADNDKAVNVLGWKPKYDNIEAIIKTAWFWEQNRRY
ncbi:MAG: UDP-glucose 4-epimerase GalE [bacterium]